MSAPDAGARRAAPWLKRAKADLAAAETIADSPERNDPWTAGFHAHQTAEKSLKAVLAFGGMDVPRVHNLQALLNLASEDWTRTHAQKNIGELDAYAVGVRYPSGDENEASLDPTWDDVAVAIKQAAAVLDAVLDDLKRKQ